MGSGRNDIIKIDEAAALSDIINITAAIAKLEASQNSLNKLHSTASAMRGQTGQAIVDQSVRLNKQIDELITMLDNSKRLIRKVVQDYRSLDHRKGSDVRRGGGI